ncbi:MAG: phosphoribosyltransferase [Candidatus Bathyarchaeota archaeon]|nr:MAG: phosphoribosyltransferase [Candidatus Bathyarchaeota archaeon]
MGSELELEIPTWEQVYEMLLSLASKIRKDQFQPDVILGISRGGWPPARVLSDLLENPELANAKTEFYMGVAETKGEPTITQPVSVSVRDKKVLVVDEIADTGKSLRLMRLHLKEQGATKIRIATIYYKPWSVVTPDYYERESSAWVVFPWERKETVRKLVEQYTRQGRNIEEVEEKFVKHGMNRKLAKRFIREVSEGQA